MKENMKKQIFFGALVALFLSGNAWNAFAGWEGYYELENGFKITRQPQGITIKISGLEMSIGESYTFSQGSSLNNMRATANGVLSILQTREEFEAEMQKLGSRIREMMVNELRGL